MNNHLKDKYDKKSTYSFRFYIYLSRKNIREGIYARPEKKAMLNLENFIV